jgi:hypothetical protein
VKLRASLALASALLLLAACQPAPLGPQPSEGTSGPPPLNDQQIRDTLVGNTIVGARTGTLLSDWSMHVAPDGTLTDSDGDTGHWNISANGQFCAQWQTAGHGQSRCYAVFRDSDTVELRSPDSVVQGKLVQGNKG